MSDEEMLNKPAAAAECESVVPHTATASIPEEDALPFELEAESPEAQTHEEAANDVAATLETERSEAEILSRFEAQFSAAEREDEFSEALSGIAAEPDIPAALADPLNRQTEEVPPKHEMEPYDMEEPEVSVVASPVATPVAAPAEYGVANHATELLSDYPIPKAAIPANRPAEAVAQLREARKAQSGSGVGGILTAQPERLSPLSYGAFLREQRERRKLSFGTLEEATKILPMHLEALEAENLDKLPPVVFVIAYIRSLCRYYHVSQAQSDHLVADLKRDFNNHPVSDELLNTVEIDNTPNAADARKIKIMLWGAGGILALFVGLIVLLAVTFFSGSDAEPPASGRGTSGAVAGNTAVPLQSGEAGFDESSLYTLLEPPTLEIVDLPVSR